MHAGFRVQGKRLWIIMRSHCDLTPQRTFQREEDKNAIALLNLKRDRIP